ncbi:alpha/beta fold hydrolase [Falsirhodobacter sp. 20TX0035]|uniref:alpha/beta fold hydrolase n=1 Tax=Falsirhodobacter sp. 20TX0035 TaxID=3022019 RepID=UPI00232E7255|nr:alpha/beta hydrolase [Falsirhodobacter sp. 20TX0035]MDB6452105.1 alpha/beta hydrolase [Falsirhodobacter sp. 20TX0035]
MRTLVAEDGTRLRARRWEGGPDTVLLLQGRTEYIEKYEPVAEALVTRGWSVATLDWRGQGGSDRALPDPMIGHVRDFSDYQMDLRAVLPVLTGRVFVIAHSMGGLIALRWLMEGADVAAIAFSAPMWGLPMEGLMRPVAHLVAGSSAVLNRADRPVPGLTPAPYVTEAPFAGNTLTSDPETFARLKADAAAMPDRMLGGPSLGWLGAALREMRTLTPRPCPPVPALAMVGSRERVVDVTAIRARMARWDGAVLTAIDGAEHEILMERPEIRAAFLDTADALFRR